MQSIIALFSQNIGLIITLALSISMLSFANWYWMKKTPGIGAEKKLPRQVLLFGMTVVAILSIILTLPISETTQGQILSLIGILLTGMIALSSTTFVANAMAGLMLRMVNTFAPGDYLRLNDQLIRVTERGLFHTEVQNEDKDLITYPNLYLVTNPVTVISHTGTVISCTLSLGYDIPSDEIEKHLILAAKSIGLETPFVLIKQLGDFSVVYKVSGFLNEVKHLVTWRSNLHKAVLNHLHHAGIEIVSPNFMNSRQFDKSEPFIPSIVKIKVEKNQDNAQKLNEEKIFDKAEVAGELSEIEKEREELIFQLKELKLIPDLTKESIIQNKIDLLNTKILNAEKNK